MATCNAETLLADAATSEFTKLAHRNKLDVLLQLLCNISDSGGGGGGASQGTEFISAGSWIPDYNGDPPVLSFITTTDFPEEYLGFDDTTTERAVAQMLVTTEITTFTAYVISSAAATGTGDWDVGAINVADGGAIGTVPASPTSIAASITANNLSIDSGTVTVESGPSGNPAKINLSIQWNAGTLTGDARLLGVLFVKAS